MLCCSKYAPQPADIHLSSGLFPDHLAVDHGRPSGPAKAILAVSMHEHALQFACAQDCAEHFIFQRTSVFLLGVRRAHLPSLEDVP